MSRKTKSARDTYATINHQGKVIVKKLQHNAQQIKTEVNKILM